MRRIPPFPLWLGTAHDVRDFPRLFEAEIQAVVDLAMEERPQPPPRELIWLRVPLVDGAGNAPAALRLAVAGVVRLLDEEIATLLACSAGMSRTPVIAAAAVAKFRNESAEGWLARIVHGHPHDITPALWRDVQAACFNPASGESVSGEGVD